MSIHIDYKNLQIIWNEWYDIPPGMNTLLNNMRNNNFKWIEHNWNIFFLEHYGLNINVVFAHDNFYYLLNFKNLAELDLFIMNFL